MKFGDRVFFFHPDGSQQDAILVVPGRDTSGVIYNHRGLPKTAWGSSAAIYQAAKQFEAGDAVIMCDGREAEIDSIQGPDIFVKLAGVRPRVVKAAPWEIFFPYGSGEA